MLKVNLISKKKRSEKRGSWVLVLLVSVFGMFVVYFLGLTVYVVFSLYSLNNELAKTKGEMVAVSQQMLGDNTSLKKYILSKLILGKIQIVNRDKFHYKDYLDQIVGLLPPGVTLQNVDFSNKGWVAVSVSIPNLASLSTFEAAINNTDLLTRSVFSTVYTGGLSKDKSGKYNMTLQFEIRKNG